MRVLGISAYFHDSAAALVVDGKIVAAAEEERFTRKKHDASFPSHSVRYVLREAGISLGDVDQVVFYEKPLLKLERLLETYLASAPRGFRTFSQAIPVWMKDKLFQKRNLTARLQEIDPHFSASCLRFCEHHLSHAASAFFASPFESAAVLTLDGVGEWTTTSLALGNGNALELLQEIHFPHSLGLLYSAFTEYLGFRVNSGEYKLMGLAPYGKPIYADLIRKNLIDLRDDGSFRLNLDYFDYCSGLRMTNRKFAALFGGPRREPESRIEPKHRDLAASVQKVLEDALLNLARFAVATTGERKLCLAGGVALNCVANGRLARSGIVDAIWVQPAAGDSGGALGAALVGYYLHPGNKRTVLGADSMQGALLGPALDEAATRAELQKAGAVFHTLDEEALLDRVAAALESGKTVGWAQGRMEFGPRALGCRSILADPRSPQMQERINSAVKRRESFRPFAPSVLREKAPEWFELSGDSPYMLDVAMVRAAHRGEIPAVTHVDHSARVQTVDGAANPLFRRLLERFEARTGCPILLNTSFNVRSEPIVCTGGDAYRCFLDSGLDVLAVGNCLLFKEEQPVAI